MSANILLKLWGVKPGQVCPELHYGQTMIESAGCAPGPQSTRADLRELENYLLAYDKASAALAAVEANARAEGER